MADDRRLSRIEQKIDDSHEHLASIDKTLIAQHISLEDHIRRTALLESKLEPVEKHIAMVNGALKLLSVIALLLGIIAGLKALK
jgi:hypothetical protein